MSLPSQERKTRRNTESEEKQRWSAHRQRKGETPIGVTFRPNVPDIPKNSYTTEYGNFN